MFFWSTIYHIVLDCSPWQTIYNTEMDQSRNCKQIWDSLQRCVNVFLSSNGHTYIGSTLQEKALSILSNGNMAKNGFSHSAR